MKKETCKKCSFNYLLDIITNAFIETIKIINKYLNEKNKSVVVKVIIRILCCLLILAILKIPFIVLGTLGEGIIYLLDATFREILSYIWNSTVSYTYCILSLIVLAKVIYDMSKRKEYKLEIDGSSKKGNNLYYALQVILKIIIAISLIPLLLTDLMLFAIVGMLICFLTHGIIIFGPMIMVIGLIIMITVSLSYISDIVFFDKGGDK